MTLFLLVCLVVLVRARLNKLSQMHLMYMVACEEPHEELVKSMADECESLWDRVRAAELAAREYETEEEL